MSFDTVDFIMQDIGTAAHTQFENGLELIDIIEANPELRKCRMGLIHSHNTMKTWFSGEDMDELHDNSQGTDFYLSIIVNNVFEPCAKIAFRGRDRRQGFIERAIKTVNSGWKAIKQELVKDEEVMFTEEVEIHVPELESLDNDIIRFRKVEAQRRPNYSQGYGYNGAKGSEDFRYDNKAKERNSGPPNFVSERQAEFNFVGNKRKESFISDEEFAEFMAKWISTDFLFEGTVEDACKRANNQVTTEADIIMYASYCIDNITSHYENVTGKLILDNNDELDLCVRTIQKLHKFTSYKVIEELLDAVKEHLEGIKNEIVEESKS